MRRASARLRAAPGLLFRRAMKLEIWRDETREGEVDLDEGEHTVGGEGAELALPGATARVRLWIEQGRLSIEATAAVRVGGLRLPQGMRRLVMPGERIELGPVSLQPVAAPEESHPATRALAFDLLGGGAEAQTPVHLTCLTGADVGRRFAVGQEAAEIGRGDGVAVRLRDRAVSRRHARVLREGLHYVIEDLGTPNGLYVDGARIAGRAVLTGGELIEIGESLLRFSAPPPPRPPKPEVEPRAIGSEPVAAPEPEAAADAIAPEASPPAAPARRARSGDWVLIALGVLVFGGGLLVSASCLRGGWSSGSSSGSPTSAPLHRDASKR